MKVAKESRDTLRGLRKMSRPGGIISSMLLRVSMSALYSSSTCICPQSVSVNMRSSCLFCTCSCTVPCCMCYINAVWCSCVAQGAAGVACQIRDRSFVCMSGLVTRCLLHMPAIMLAFSSVGSDVEAPPQGISSKTVMPRVALCTQTKAPRQVCSLPAR